MKRILVIEDNLEIRENTAEVLELNGYESVTAENGRTGFEKALIFKPDVVVCDMMMPGTDGRGFLALMKENESTFKIPIIFFSAGTPEPKVRQYLIENGDAYLRKPFTNAELLNAVIKFTNHHNH